MKDLTNFLKNNLNKPKESCETYRRAPLRLMDLFREEYDLMRHNLHTLTYQMAEEFKCELYKQFCRIQCCRDDENYWYVERWEDEDLELALKSSGIACSEENKKKLADECRKNFSDLSCRLEFISERAEVLFKREKEEGGTS